MTIPKVGIIVSTYNGEKYIEEQLESLLNQDYKNIEITVRDDGSTDETLTVLSRYEKERKIRLVTGKNLGYCGSFFELLRQTEDCDYWSFCDQDDIWEPYKVSRAVEFLEKEKLHCDKPLLYYSFSNMVNEAGEFLGIQKPPENSLCFPRALTGTFGVGFSMVINGELRDAMLLCEPQKVYAHDWLAGAIALGFGKVIIDETICASYRRLDTSVTKISFGRRVQWFLNTFTKQGDVQSRNIEYGKHFYDRLSEKDKRYMEWFMDEKYSLLKALKKCFYLKRWRPSWSSEISMRILMLLGRV